MLEAHTIAPMLAAYAGISAILAFLVGSVGFFASVVVLPCAAAWAIALS